MQERTTGQATNHAPKWQEWYNSSAILECASNSTASRYGPLNVCRSRARPHLQYTKTDDEIAYDSLVVMMTEVLTLST